MILFDFDQDGALLNCLGRVKGLYINDETKELFVRMFTHEQVKIHEGSDGSVDCIDWIQLGDSEHSERGSDVFECSIKRLLNIEVLTIEQQKRFHRVIAMFSGSVMCKFCSKWLRFYSDQVNFRQRFQEAGCPHCHKVQSLEPSTSGSVNFFFGFSFFCE